MKKTTTACLLLLTLLIVSCKNNNKAQGAIELADASTLMDESMQRFAGFWNSGDSEGISNEFTSDAVRILTDPSDAIEGNEAIKTSFLNAFSEESLFKNSHIEIDVIETRFVSDDILIGSGLFKILSDSDEILESGKWGNVFKYADGKIKFLLESAYRNVETKSDLSDLVVMKESLESSDEAHFNEVKNFIDDFVTDFTNGEREKLSLSFIENGIRTVSGTQGVLVGIDNISSSFDIVEGEKLNANILGYKYLNNSLAIGYGQWERSDKENNVLTSGNWGNIFLIQDQSVKFVMESAGIVKDY
jgi:uncharacterized protein (TIGR02246 family)|tara:strand:+ start:2739 stop:3647 length:909 start_codon:yes stop_codon:yes gene_type:complete